MAIVNMTLPSYIPPQQSIQPTKPQTVSEYVAAGGALPGSPNYTGGSTMIPGTLPGSGKPELLGKITITKPGEPGFIGFNAPKPVVPLDQSILKNIQLKPGEAPKLIPISFITKPGQPEAVTYVTPEVYAKMTAANEQAQKDYAVQKSKYEADIAESNRQKEEASKSFAQQVKEKGLLTTIGIGVAGIGRGFKELGGTLIKGIFVPKSVKEALLPFPAQQILAYAGQNPTGKAVTPQETINLAVAGGVIVGTAILPEVFIPGMVAYQGYQTIRNPSPENVVGLGLTIALPAITKAGIKVAEIAKPILKEIKIGQAIENLNKTKVGSIILREDLAPVLRETGLSTKIRVEPVEKFVGASKVTDTGTQIIKEEFLGLQKGAPIYIEPKQLTNPDFLLISGRQIGKTTPTIPERITMKGNYPTSPTQPIVKPTLKPQEVVSSDINRVIPAKKFQEFIASNRIELVQAPQYISLMRIKPTENYIIAARKTTITKGSEQLPITKVLETKKIVTNNIIMKPSEFAKILAKKGIINYYEVETQSLGSTRSGKPIEGFYVAKGELYSRPSITQGGKLIIGTYEANKPTIVVARVTRKFESNVAHELVHSKTIPKGYTSIDKLFPYIIKPSEIIARIGARYYKRTGFINKEDIIITQESGKVIKQPSYPILAGESYTYQVSGRISPLEIPEMSRALAKRVQPQRYTRTTETGALKITNINYKTNLISYSDENLFGNRFRPILREPIEKPSIARFRAKEAKVQNIYEAKLSRIEEVKKRILPLKDVSAKERRIVRKGIIAVDLGKVKPESVGVFAKELPLYEKPSIARFRAKEAKVQNIYEARQLAIEETRMGLRPIKSLSSKGRKIIRRELQKGLVIPKHIEKKLYVLTESGFKEMPYIKRKILTIKDIIKPIKEGETRSYQGGQVLITKLITKKNVKPPIVINIIKQETTSLSKQETKTIQKPKLESVSLTKVETPSQYAYGGSRYAESNLAGLSSETITTPSLGSASESLSATLSGRKKKPTVMFEEVIISKPSMAKLQQPKIISVTKQESGLIMPMLIQPELRSQPSISITEPISAVKPISIVKPDLGQIQQPISAVKTSQELQQPSLSELAQPSLLDQPSLSELASPSLSEFESPSLQEFRLEQPQLYRQRFKRPIEPEPKIPRRFIFGGGEEGKKKKKVEELFVAKKAYAVFLKSKLTKLKKGQYKSRGFEQVSTEPLTREAAIGLGASLTDIYAQRSFTIKEIKGTPVARPELEAKAQALLYKFRTAKRNREIFVEKAKFAISSLEEKKAIPYEALRQKKQQRMILLGRVKANKKAKYAQILLKTKDKLSWI